MTTQLQKPLRGKEKPRLKLKGMKEWLWFVDKLLEKYASRELYDKFVEGNYAFTQDIKNEWWAFYMGNSKWICYAREYNDWALSLESEYNTLFKKRKEVQPFIRFISYISVLLAPKFHEQLDEETKSEVKENITIIK